MTDTDLAMLPLAGQRFRCAGSLEVAVREQFDMTAVAFWQRANWLLNEPAAKLAEPMLVARLGRLRGARVGARVARPQLQRDSARASR